MADPTKYTPGYSFTDYQASNPSDPLPATEVDTELANIATSTEQLVNAVKDIRRSDGKLKNELVTYDSLAPELKAQVGIGIDAALVAAQAAQAAAELAEDNASASAGVATTAAGTATTAAGTATTAATAAQTAQSAAQTAQSAAETAAASLGFRTCGLATGTANALVLTPSLPLLSYAGSVIEFIVATPNTTEAMTVNVSGLGATALKVNLNGTERDPAIGMFRAGMKIIAGRNSTNSAYTVINTPWDNQGSDVASASTVDLTSSTGNFVNLTGTTTVTAITGITRGRRVLIRHTGAHILTHSATLVCLGATNITTVAGDISEWVSDGTAMYMISYQRATRTQIDNVNASQLSGFRNVLINANFAINQRAYVSGTATVGANQYTLDRWRVVTSGQSLTFSASGIGNQITAPAGGVEQVVEGVNIIGGSYTISWTGTATCTVNGTARVSGETFTLTGNTNATVRFIGGTVQNAQLEVGVVPTQFENRNRTLELILCERYCQIVGNGFSGASAGAGSVEGVEKLRTPMRVNPTAAVIGGVACSMRISGMGTPDQSAATPALNAPTLTTESIWTQITGFSGLTANLPAQSRNVTNSRFILLTAEL